VHLDPVGRPLSLLPLLAAGALGAALACTNFGWYLAIASLLGAHNNEAGGAARLETHRLLLRIRLHPGGLTAYAIGIDACNADASALRPHLVDVFELRAPGP
jgi:hypothetical protein